MRMVDLIEKRETEKSCQKKNWTSLLGATRTEAFLIIK